MVLNTRVLSFPVAFAGQLLTKLDDIKGLKLFPYKSLFNHRDISYIAIHPLVPLFVNEVTA